MTKVVCILLSVLLTGCTTCDEFLCFRESKVKEQERREFREFMDLCDAHEEAGDFWEWWDGTTNRNAR